MRKLLQLVRDGFTIGLFTFLMAGSAGAAETNGPTSARPRGSGEQGLGALRSSLSYRVVLAPHNGKDRLDEDIRRSQDRVGRSAEPAPYLERLGWLYVAKARASHDNGFYSLAEHCALALQVPDPRSCEALLLRGHVAQSRHQFRLAESLGQELVARRGLGFDYGLWGDALVDQGRLAEAIPAYQRMVDLRPDLQAYIRIAHVRWLTGDLEGAIAVARLAVQAGGPADPEPTAWAYARLATYEFQADQASQAEAACANALALVPGYAPAQLLRGRMLLAAGKTTAAVTALRSAAKRNPIPEYQWTLAEALRAAGQLEESSAVEGELKRTGTVTDPRTLSLFLSTRGAEVNLASNLARQELEERSDIFTQDALAWSLCAAGRRSEAWSTMQRALSEGTADARLFLHAGVIATRCELPEAGIWLAQAQEMQRLLLPSERQQLERALSQFTEQENSSSIGRPVSQALLARPIDFRRT